MQSEAIYKGATRPAMKLGVPLVPLVLLSGSGLLICLWGGLLLSGWIALAVLAALLPTFFWMRIVTSRDDQRLRQMLVALKLRRWDRNHGLWNARSYAPNLYRGASDAWHT
ncbi:VirB3 family type IV secretion system protein [Paucibacter sp. DJ2R-2]|uniref:VirB3 family type IV secretion system protein n=1 Tax=Paucibacter sp. DJ2R-2 TaxID=2893558 RepID=UPI0021E45ABB|nr:VirB3 family type IV secretion system protein [Paucibacter sp. DJ2R-2]MCV2438586.1 VirB3 family type IV secretion system protein [Paucibacter sp. DJ2R-2]